MATLHGKTTADRDISFQITPVTLTRDGRADAYILKVRHADYEAFERTYDVEGWNAGHLYILRIAQMFRNAGDLPSLAAQWPRTDDNAPITSPMCYRESVRWLEVVMWGKKFLRFEKPLIFVQVNISTDFKADAADDSVSSRQFFRLNCDVDDCVNFGKSLSIELAEAHEMRNEVGLPAFEEQW